MTVAANLSQGASNKAVATTNVVAAGGATTAGLDHQTQMHIFGEYLTTNGLGILSFGEWFQVITAVWLSMQILRMLGIPCALRWAFAKMRGHK